MYLHICIKETCSACNRPSCSCEQHFSSKDMVMEYRCPFCGAIMSSSIMSTSSGTDFNIFDVTYPVLEDAERSEADSTHGEASNH